jgi:endonuclease YncB( thermonuclease family)
MKKSFHIFDVSYILFLISCFLLPVTCFAADENLQAIADYVFDGDTFSARVKLENDVGISVRVRIRNIDAPEIHGECESETELAGLARTRLMEIIPRGTAVKLSKIKDDKYLGRIDALVSLDEKDIGQIMMNEKLARKYDGKKRQSWCENKGEIK